MSRYDRFYPDGSPVDVAPLIKAEQNKWRNLRSPLPKEPTLEERVSKLERQVFIHEKRLWVVERKTSEKVVSSKERNSGRGGE